MGNEGVDLVTVSTSSNKKTLLERYDIPIEHLSYEYVSECTKVKELERIILILRSGEEGIYPDLTRHAEERLTAIKPDSTVLRKAVPVVSRNSLAPERKKILENDLNKWMNEMKLREKDLEEGRNLRVKEPIPQPAIREITINEHKKNEKTSRNRENNKRISSFDYAAWDKYDADTELDRIDLKHEQKQAQIKRNQQKLREKEEKIKKSSRESIVNKLTLTGTEYNIMAEEERKKGNEAFKAGDYDEALQFYNLSIAIDATPQAYNNRAITFIKLRRYSDAVNDCNRVISIEHKNIKALLRRGLALEHLEKHSQALADYEAVLKTEPINKLAIAAINKLRGPCNSRTIKMKIEEESTETVSSKVVERLANENYHPTNTKFLHKKNQQISQFVESTKIPNKSEPSCRSSSESGPQIVPKLCFCNNAPSSSQQTSPLPHLRDIYCSEMRGKSQKFPKLQSIFTDTKKSHEKSSGVIIEEIPNVSYEKSSGVIIEEIPNETCENSVLKSEKINKSAKIKSQERTLGSGDNSYNVGERVGKFIEEIPEKQFDRKEKIPTKEIHRREEISINEVYCKEETLAKEVHRNKEVPASKVDCKEEISAKEVHRKGEILANEEVDRKEISTKEVDRKEEISANNVDRKKMSAKKLDYKEGNSVNDVNCQERIYAKEVHCKEKISTEEVVRKEEISAKKVDRKEISAKKVDCKEEIGVKEVNRKEEITNHIQFDKISSPYEFLKLWHSFKNDSELVLRTRILLSIPPEHIDTVIGNKMDGDMFSIILRCFEKHFCVPEHSKLLHTFLQSLTRLKRFSLVCMFMDKKDKEVLRSVFTFLEAHIPEDIQYLRKVYDISM